MPPYRLSCSQTGGGLAGVRQPLGDLWESHDSVRSSSNYNMAADWGGGDLFGCGDFGRGGREGIGFASCSPPLSEVRIGARAFAVDLSSLGLLHFSATGEVRVVHEVGSGRQYAAKLVQREHHDDMVSLLPCSCCFLRQYHAHAVYTLIAANPCPALRATLRSHEHVRMQMTTRH